MNEKPEPRKTEEWTTFQRILPILIGAVFMILGLFILLISALNYVEFVEYQRWGYFVWSAVLILFGLFILILRFKILPGVRIPE